MCFATPSSSVKSPTSGSTYYCSKLNETTHLVVQNDEYCEFPFIYVKVYWPQSLAVVIDTGCGVHRSDGNTSPGSLKEFILANILGSRQTQFDFLIICTHCHFDHIGGIEAFSDAPIVASGCDRSFLRPEDRERNSLCGAFGTKTPEYEVSHYAEDKESLGHRGYDLGLRMIHTPGHTPDSMAIYDEKERWLFVGDTCYQRVAMMPWGEEQDVPIILPLQGNWRDFIASLQELRKFVGEEDEKPLIGGSTARTIQLAAGHTTSQTPAADFLLKVNNLCEDVASGKVPVFARMPGDAAAPGGSLGHEMFVIWQSEENTGLSLMAPESFMKAF